MVIDMAIFHMSFSNISAGKGRSAIASAAYRSGEKLFDDKEGRSYFYARSVMPESFILTPENGRVIDKNFGMKLKRKTVRLIRDMQKNSTLPYQLN